MGTRRIDWIVLELVQRRRKDTKGHVEIRRFLPVSLSGLNVDPAGIETLSQSLRQKTGLPPGFVAAVAIAPSCQQASAGRTWNLSDIEEPEVAGPPGGVPTRRAQLNGPALLELHRFAAALRKAEHQGRHIAGPCGVAGNRNSADNPASRSRIEIVQVVAARENISEYPADIDGREPYADKSRSRIYGSRARRR